MKSLEMRLPGNVIVYQAENESVSPMCYIKMKHSG